jgi:spermidine/putrescine transport system permease protein
VRKFSFGRYALPVYSVLAFVYLLIPIGFTFFFSFNDYRRSNITWRGFTLDNWTSVCEAQGVCAAFATSISIGLISTLIATTLGTMIAIALVRYRFKFRSTISLLLFLPMATPELVLGAGLAAQFFNFGVEMGFTTIVIAHVMFCLSFVVVTVQARVASLDPALGEAATDLYGSPSQVFWKVTFPLLLPGIMAAALLSFALSFDDFIITYFNSGPTETFPKFVYTAAAKGLPGEANVIGIGVFFLAIAIVVTIQIRSSIKAKRLAAVK